MDIKDLFSAVQTAYETYKEKEAEKESAGEVYHAASAECEAALKTLNEYRAQLNDMLGNVASNPRIRLSA